MKLLISAFLILFSLQATAITVSKSGGDGLFSPISISVAPDVGQFPPPGWGVVGARLSALWGRNKNMFGLDLGLIGNITDENFVGSAVSGLFNSTGKTATVIGAQVAGLGNFNQGKATILGAQAAIITNVNKAEATLVGLQASLINMSAMTDVYGLQLGLYNRARHVVGFQIGLVNVTDSLFGFQIGFLNFNNEGHPFKFFPIINFGF